MKKLFLILAVICLITGCSFGNKKTQSNDNSNSIVEHDDGAIVNNNSGVVKDQKVENFKFEKTSLVYNREVGEGGTSTLTTMVTNIGNKDEELQEFKIDVKDKDGSTIITLTGLVGDVLKAGESRPIVSYCGLDLTNAVSIEYTVVR